MMGMMSLQSAHAVSNSSVPVFSFSVVAASMDFVMRRGRASPLALMAA